MIRMRQLHERWALICCVIGGLFVLGGVLFGAPAAFAFAVYFYIRSIHMAIYSTHEDGT